VNRFSVGIKTHLNALKKRQPEVAKNNTLQLMATNFQK